MLALAHPVISNLEATIVTACIAVVMIGATAWASR